MSDTTTHSDERVLAARAATDFDAFAELYRRYLPRIHAFAHKRTGNVEAAEDICSATFESALNTIGSFTWGKGGFAPWIFRIASRQTIAHYRREGRSGSERGQAAMSLLSGGSSPGVEEAVQLDEFASLRAALSELNPRYQQAISLRYLADLDTADAATAMGMSKTAFSVVLTRATAALRKKLDALEGGATT